jgi:hypothetical protein
MCGRGGGRYTISRRANICSGRLRGHELRSHPFPPRKARGCIGERASARPPIEFDALGRPAFFSHDETGKIALAVASIWPVVWMLIFVMFLVGPIFFMSSNLEHDGHGFGRRPYTLSEIERDDNRIVIAQRQHGRRFHDLGFRDTGG